MTHTRRPSLSIVIISWNSLPRLRDCIEALAPVLARPETTLYWIDNGSSDGAYEYMAGHCPDARLFRFDTNRGVAAARNVGLSRSQSDYTLILDDDTIPTAEAIDRMTSHLDANPATGICAVALRAPDGSLQDSFKGFPSPLVKIANVVRARLGIGRRVRLPQGVIHPTYVIGACQMIRTDVIRRIGLLDEQIFFGPEDADYCLRASAAGYSIDYLPDASMIHHWQRSTTRSLTSAAARRHISALLHFYRRHRRLF